MSNKESRRSIPNNDSEVPDEPVHTKYQFQELPGARTKKLLAKLEQLGEHPSEKDRWAWVDECMEIELPPRVKAFFQKSPEKRLAQEKQASIWRERRKALGLTLKEVAENVGISWLELLWTECGFFAPGGLPEEVACRLNDLLLSKEE